MHKLCCCIVLFVFLSACGKGQGIRIGKKFPEGRYTRFMNSAIPELDISDYKGKAVIVEFLSIGCLSCIKALPRIDSMQRRFKGEVEFVLAYRESKKELEEFFEQRKQLRLPAVPVVTSAGWLFELLPAPTLLASVWVDKASVVRYITMEYTATEKRIHAFLVGERLAVSNIDRPMREKGRSLLDDKEGISEIDYYSYIGHCKNYIDIGNYLRKDSQSVRLAVNCQSVVELCKKAFEENNRYRFDVPASVALDVQDSFLFVRPGNSDLWDEWERNHCFNYELVMPISKASFLYPMMQEELQRYFNLEVRVEKRSVRALVLVRTCSEDRLHTKGGTPEYRLYPSSVFHPLGDSTRYLRNKPFSLLSRVLEGWVEGTFHCPFSDETNYRGPIDISFEGKLIDALELTEFRKRLNEFGLDLKEGTKQIDVLVIRERG
jgi:thiol-disulfide isomerase/thioredoxin